MKRLKLFLLVVLASVLCCACGSAEGVQSDSDGTSKVFEVDGEKLENEGYTQVEDVVYAKIEDSVNGPIVHMTCCKNMPVVCMYVMQQILEGVEQEVDKVVIVWNGVEYVVNKDMEGFPREWQETMNTMVEEGKTLNGVISVEVAEALQRDIDDIVGDYLSTKEIPDENETVSSEETSSSSELERKEIKKEVYELEQMTVTMILSQDTENALYFSVGVKSEVAWKVAYSFLIYNGLLELEELNPVIMAYNDEVFLSTIGFSMMKKTGAFIDAGEWCAEQVVSDAFNQEKAETLGDELQELVLEFLELNE